MAQLVYHAYIYPSVSNMFETISAWMTLALGFERLHAMHYWSSPGGVKVSATRVRLIVAAIFVAAFFINLPFLFSVTISSSHEMEMSDFGKSLGFVIFSWIRASLVQFLPLVILCVLNLILVAFMGKWRRASTLGPAWSTANRRQKAHQRLTAMLVGSIVLFIMSNIPVAFAYMPIFCSIKQSNVETTLTAFSVYRVITHAVSLIGYSLDFVVYCLSNSHFRFTASDIFCHQCHSRKRVQPSMSVHEAKAPEKHLDVNNLSNCKSSSPVPPDISFIQAPNNPISPEVNASCKCITTRRVTPEHIYNEH